MAKRQEPGPETGIPAYGSSLLTMPSIPERGLRPGFSAMT